MATFKSSKYPALTLQDEKGIWAQFKEGRFETSDATVAKRLRALPEEEGVLEAKSSEKSSEPKAPAKSASKDDWVDWAVACGADRDEAATLTRDDLAGRFADATPQQ